ncbi:MAG: response regulator [Methylotenera sp.]|nr:response regulator [Methylotenera sp.]MDO9390111.1 response regulator [Methylotenera sp.]
MNSLKEARSDSTIVLIVDDMLDNLAVLHDALDESGFTVLVANHGEAALTVAAAAQPDVILLDAIMPGMDGFEVCRKLKADINTRHIPIIFMTGLTESEHVVAAFQAGGTDYITKPIRVVEVLARIEAHLLTSRLMSQARGALDAFGQAAIAITPSNGKIVWQTPLAREWMLRYFSQHYVDYPSQTPPQLMAWIGSIAISNSHQGDIPSLTIVQSRGRLNFIPADTNNDEQWVILLREESDAAQIEALMTIFKLTMRESEVLYWATKGKTSRDIGDILGTSPRTVNKHLEHIYIKLGVETRTAAAALATSKIRTIK